MVAGICTKSASSDTYQIYRQITQMWNNLLFKGMTRLGKNVFTMHSISAI